MLHDFSVPSLILFFFFFFFCGVCVGGAWCRYDVCDPIRWYSDTAGAGWELRITKEDNLMRIMGLDVTGKPLPKDVRTPM